MKISLLFVLFNLFLLAETSAFLNPSGHVRSAITTTTVKSQVNDETLASTSSEKVAVLICPAQFCVPADYQNLIETLQAKNPSIISAKVAPLPRYVNNNNKL